MTCVTLFRMMFVLSIQVHMTNDHNKRVDFKEKLRANTNHVILEIKKQC